METRKLSELQLNPLNPRTLIDDGTLGELADSIKSVGLLQPLIVTTKNVIVAGHRRFEAARMAGLSEVAVIVRDLTEVEQISVMLIENMQRRDLNPVQEAQAFRELTARGLTLNNLATVLGLAAAGIKMRLSILDLPEEARRAFEDRKVSLMCVSCVASLTPAQQVEWITKASEKGWSAAKLTAKIEDAYGPKDCGEVNRIILDRVLERVESGCYTPETIDQCDECGSKVFPSLTRHDINCYLQTLVDRGKAEWRKQGGKNEGTNGGARLCVPKGTPFGSSLNLGREREDKEALA